MDNRWKHVHLQDIPVCRIKLQPFGLAEADIDGNTQVTIDRGIVTAYGFLTFGSTAGMRADGPIRLWCGGTKDNPTFQVSNAGEVMAKQPSACRTTWPGLPA